MLTIGSYEAKTHLSDLLRKVGEGERITITKHGVPIARLVPFSDGPNIDLDQVVRDLKEFGKEHSLGGLSLQDMIHEGHKY